MSRPSKDEEVQEAMLKDNRNENTGIRGLIQKVIF